MWLLIFRLLLVVWCGAITVWCAHDLYIGRGFFVNIANITLNVLIGGYTVYALYQDHKKIKSMTFSLRYKVAQTLILQIKAGEWKPVLYRNQEKVYNLERNGQRMWVANGADFLTIDDQDLLGYILKHYVWNKAAKQVAIEANKAFPPPNKVNIANKLITEKPTLKVVK